MPDEPDSDAERPGPPPVHPTDEFLGDDYLTPMQRERDREAFDEFIVQAGVTPSASAVTSAGRAHEAVVRLDAVLERLRAMNSNAVSPRKGMAFVLREDVIAYLTSVRNRYADRSALLAQREQLAVIESAVEQKVADPAARQELTDLVAEFRRRQETAATAHAREGADELARLDIVAKRWEVRKAMLEREPAAVLVGGVLLVGIAIALIVAMFAHTPIPEILASGFLLILGFFFGQNSTRGGGSSSG